MKKHYWKTVFGKRNHVYLKRSHEIVKKINKYQFNKLAYELSKVIYNSNISFFKNLVNLVASKLKIKKQDYCDR